MDRYTIMTRRIRREFPDFQVRQRNGTWLKYPFWLMSKITRTNYDRFVNTIGSTIYVGPGWNTRPPNGKYRTLRHELVHIRQFHDWPLGPKWWRLNHILLPLCYLFVLPFLWTYRAKLEREGYTQSLLVDFELGGNFTDQEMEINAKRLVKTFAGPAYAWMWTRKKAYIWAMETQKKINLGEISNPNDRIGDLEAYRDVL